MSSYSLDSRFRGNDESLRRRVIHSQAGIQVGQGFDVHND